MMPMAVSTALTDAQETFEFWWYCVWPGVLWSLCILSNIGVSMVLKPVTYCWQWNPKHSTYQGNESPVTCYGPTRPWNSREAFCSLKTCRVGEVRICNVVRCHADYLSVKSPQFPLSPSSDLGPMVLIMSRAWALGLKNWLRLSLFALANSHCLQDKFDLI